ncbi:ABC transporter permease [Pseudomonas typographi]|uniref:ABC transporter permease n=1 Tax=Pseudomonas typographi TaxID=2715964 RepID=A0ABR7Z2X7_9PSED|nr:ABC transporter permease [Pseudomonas typographi]MBD1553127.1 ABC transporter permease [Pseudomonas typographi]MBD1585886.1 ABC transporter permease [Pseudomonas typographi]MBD1599748.1 ABC transporter permease [Pseudomonas typographi]
MVRSLVVLLIVALWWTASASGSLSADLLPSPAQVIAACVGLVSDGDLAQALSISLYRAFVGFFIGSGIGLVLGLFAGLLKVGEQLVDAPMQIFRAIPFIALLPLFITWFGIGEYSKVMLIISATIFPVYLNTYGGARNVDKKLIEMARSFKLSSARIALRIVLPTSLPSIFVGLRYSSSTALLALVVSEQLNASSGIGYLLMTANQQQNSDIVIAIVIVYAIFGVLLDMFWRLAEHFALPWRAKIAL